MISNRLSPCSDFGVTDLSRTKKCSTYLMNVSNWAEYVVNDVWAAGKRNNTSIAGTPSCNVVTKTHGLL